MIRIVNETNGQVILKCKVCGHQEPTELNVPYWDDEELYKFYKQNNNS